MVDQQKNRFIPAHADAFQYPLPNFAKRLKGQGPIKIVAIGSSSTEGEGNIVPYPSRLKVQLSMKYPNRSIVVVNRGIGGEELGYRDRAQVPARERGEDDG